MNDIRNDILKDVSIITTIPYDSLKDICKKEELCISHSVLECKNNKDHFTYLDIGIGKLGIKIDEDEIQYKFIPSSRLEQMLVNTISTNTSPLISIIENKVNSRIINVYKDLI